MSVTNVQRSVRPTKVTFLLLLAVALICRAATLRNPVIGYDEQFYLLVGDRMGHGLVPYVDIFDRKPVGIFVIYWAIRLLGGAGFVQYKLVAGATVVATGYLLARTARANASTFAAATAAILYILWLNFMGGEGGQTPVFFNPLMLGAAALMLNAVRSDRALVGKGVAALALVGIALQIKYSALFEGIYFGCAFLYLAGRRRYRPLAICGFAGSMVTAALLPTLAALVYYWSIGQTDNFVFCNFVSIFGQAKGAFLFELGHLAAIVAILSPLLAFAFVRPRPATESSSERRLLTNWLVAAALGIVAYWRFNSPQYALSILPPLCLFIAPSIDRYRRTGIGVAIVALIAGQVVLQLDQSVKGGLSEAFAVAAAAKPRKGCLYVYDGYPALYMLTGSCLPSRWAFPGSLNAADENSTRALGAPPTAIERAILARHPDTIVDRYPDFDRGNLATHSLVMAAIRADYRLAACIPTPRGVVRLVYRRSGDGGGTPAGRCSVAIRRQAVGNVA